jgi:hypothetical protein
VDYRDIFKSGSDDDDNNDDDDDDDGAERFSELRVDDLDSPASSLSVRGKPRPRRKPARRRRQAETAVEDDSEALEPPPPPPAPRPRVKGVWKPVPHALVNQASGSRLPHPAQATQAISNDSSDNDDSSSSDDDDGSPIIPRKMDIDTALTPPPPNQATELYVEQPRLFHENPKKLIDIVVGSVVRRARKGSVNTSDVDMATATSESSNEDGSKPSSLRDPDDGAPLRKDFRMSSNGEGSNDEDDDTRDSEEDTRPEHRSRKRARSSLPPAAPSKRQRSTPSRPSTPMDLLDSTQITPQVRDATSFINDEAEEDSNNEEEANSVRKDVELNFFDSAVRSSH